MFRPFRAGFHYRTQRIMTDRRSYEKSLDVSNSKCKTRKFRMKILLLHKHYTRDVHTVTQNTEKLSIKMKIKVTVEPNARRQRQWVTRSGTSVVQWYASYIVSITSVSETIRKPLLVKAQTALRKQKNGEKRFSIWRMEFLHSAMWHVHDIDFARWQPCNVAIGSGITTVNSPSGSTMQCDTWLWDDMPLNLPKRPPYWNSTSGFDFSHIIIRPSSFCTSLRNFIQIGPPSAEKNDVMSIFKMADLRHFGL